MIGSIHLRVKVLEERSMVTGDKLWYLARDGYVQGPYAQSEVTEKISVGEVDEHFFVYGPGYTQWQPLMNSEAFADVLADSPPPPPPPIASATPPNVSLRPKQEQEASNSEKKVPYRRRRWLRGFVFAFV